MKATKKVTKKADNFQDNPFAKKYKEELNDKGTKKSNAKFFPDDFYLESAEQVKSWNKYGVGYQLVSIQSLFWSFVLGFSVCAVLLTNL